MAQIYIANDIFDRYVIRYKGDREKIKERINEVLRKDVGLDKV